MTPDELRTQVEQAMSVWRPRLRLLDWILWAEVRETSNVNHACETEKEWRARRARLIFPEDFIDRSRRDGVYREDEPEHTILSESVIHELLHVLEEPLAQQVNDEIEWIYGSDSVIGASLRNVWRDYREHWINVMAQILIEADRTKGWNI